MAQPGGCEVRWRHRRRDSVDSALVFGLGRTGKCQRHWPEPQIEDPVAEPRLVVVIALVLGGAHGKLLDADHDRLGFADVQAFEMEELMHSKAAALAVLRYLFARFEERLDGAPTLLILDEAWLFLDDPVFATRIRQWLKTLRKKNVSVIFATQSLADIKDSSIAPAIIESCVNRIFLPNQQATEPQIRSIYEGFGLNSRQINIVATAQPKRDYYYQSRLGNRVFDLGLGPVALAFAGAAKPEEIGRASCRERV